MTAHSKLGRPRELARESIYKGRIFEVAGCDLRFQNGRRARNDLVVHGGAAVFAPIPAPGKILLIRQYRHAAADFLWEIPAGRIEAGERPLATAKRELAEECRLDAGRWRKATAFYPAPGYATEVMHLYFAYDLRLHRAGARPDHDEEITTKIFSTRELDRMIQKGTIIDGKTIAAALYLKLGFDKPPAR